MIFLRHIMMHVCWLLKHSFMALYLMSWACSLLLRECCTAGVVVVCCNDCVSQVTAPLYSLTVCYSLFHVYSCLKMLQCTEIWQIRLAQNSLSVSFCLVYDSKSQILDIHVQRFKRIVHSFSLSLSHTHKHCWIWIEQRATTGRIVRAGWGDR